MPAEPHGKPHNAETRTGPPAREVTFPPLAPPPTASGCACRRTGTGGSRLSTSNVQFLASSFLVYVLYFSLPVVGGMVCVKIAAVLQDQSVIRPNLGISLVAQ